MCCLIIDFQCRAWNDPLSHFGSCTLWSCIGSSVGLFGENRRCGCPCHRPCPWRYMYCSTTPTMATSTDTMANTMPRMTPVSRPLPPLELPLVGGSVLLLLTLPLPPMVVLLPPPAAGGFAAVPCQSRVRRVSAIWLSNCLALEGMLQVICRQGVSAYLRTLTTLFAG